MAASKKHSEEEEEIVTRTTIVPRGLQAAQHTAVEAAQALGRGFDVTSDFRLGFVKGAVGSVLVKIEQENLQNLVAPGGIVIPDVSSDIRCVTGENTHYKSDLLPFVEMSQQFNQDAAIEGNVPLGLFNSMYGFNGPWQTDQHSTKALALDGRFIRLYSLRLTQSPLVLHDQVLDAVPSVWDPKKLARYLQRCVHFFTFLLSVNFFSEHNLGLRYWWFPCLFQLHRKIWDPHHCWCDNWG
jgi:hypothetical protein